MNRNELNSYKILYERTVLDLELLLKTELELQKQEVLFMDKIRQMQTTRLLVLDDQVKQLKKELKMVTECQKVK